jgi:hypothetical protein
MGDTPSLISERNYAHHLPCEQHRAISLLSLHLAIAFWHATALILHSLANLGSFSLRDRSYDVH